MLTFLLWLPYPPSRSQTIDAFRIKNEKAFAHAVPTDPMCSCISSHRSNVYLDLLKEEEEDAYCISSVTQNRDIPKLKCPTVFLIVVTVTLHPRLPPAVRFG